VPTALNLLYVNLFLSKNNDIEEDEEGSGAPATFSFGGMTVARAERQVYSDEEDYEDEMSGGLTGMDVNAYQYGSYGGYDETSSEEDSEEDTEEEKDADKT
jgi:hypothetical protein